ncbi:hypothetical protein M8C21_015421 [Ambrosia artemisiifolia]|uniref:Uncharacterized protein n=1 Tax=Ambrosia artemisiifolia TaxID=4212 RepID=A0AAD5D021_AMBAR|nr:hypothetical protein M8C21_015421 [Ambrosia artemisiifolia]
MLKENASGSSVEKQKEYNKGCPGTRKENGKRISNGIKITQTPIDDATPTTTFTSIIHEVMPDRSRGSRIQPRTLLPQFCEVIGQPSIHDENAEIDPYNFVYDDTFRCLAELGPLDNCRVTLNASVELDQRVYNRPTTSEVAGIWVEGNDNITSFKRSIVVYGKTE